MLRGLANAGWIAAFVVLCAVWGYEVMNARRRSYTMIRAFGFVPSWGNAVPQERRASADGELPLIISPPRRD
jgi:hypothetical protein